MKVKSHTEKQQATAKHARTAILNAICEEFDHDPEIMKRIEALPLEEEIKRFL